MKQAFHKISSFLMAFVVLFSTMSFTVDMHYCGDNLVETAVFQKAKGCGMEMENPSTGGCSVKMKDCCSDEQLVVDGQDELKISFGQKFFVASFVYTYIHIFESIDKKVVSYQEYIPPLVVRQIYKLDEAYLI
ncbi:HYC_CC_PP family protein [Ascidiimonas aurantiaca]|uniref:HYC_CC_PP family protein n=1 Tax=Ascidiimonas aurantiaca TaxID=1685432 RepID=UPI0030EDACD7